MHREQPSLAVRAGYDAEAFAELYDQYYGRVYTYIRYRCDDDRTVEDLTAQVFEKLLASITRYCPEQAPFEAWLFGIVRHVVGDHLRWQRLNAWLPWEAFLNRPAPDPLPEEVAAQQDLEARLAGLLPKLKAQERDLIGLKYAGGLTNRQIADLTGLSEQNVAVILFRAIEKLRRSMDERAKEGR
jgi:RNA polymerase sigma factor (sigma-70 family)